LAQPDGQISAVIRFSAMEIFMFFKAWKSL